MDILQVMECESLADESDSSTLANSPLSPNRIKEWRRYHDETSVATYSTSGSRAIAALQDEVASFRGVREEVAELRAALAAVTTRLDEANMLAMDRVQKVQGPQGLGRQVDNLVESLKFKFGGFMKTVESSLSTLEGSVQSLKQAARDDKVEMNQTLESFNDSLHDSLYDTKSSLDNMLDLFPRLLASHVAASSTFDAQFSLRIANLGPLERQVVAEELNLKEQLTAQGLLDAQAKFTQAWEESSCKRKLLIERKEKLASHINAMIEVGGDV